MEVEIKMEMEEEKEMGKENQMEEENQKKELKRKLKLKEREKLKLKRKQKKKQKEKENMLPRSQETKENSINDNVIAPKKAKNKKSRPLPAQDEETKKCLEAVDLLADLTKFDRQVVIFALAAFSGNVEAAYRYLNGEIQAAWKFSDDIAILTRDSSVVTELLKTKTVDELSARFDFLNGLCDAP
jgi:hypothetical protein